MLANARLASGTPCADHRGRDRHRGRGGDPSQRRRSQGHRARAPCGAARAVRGIVDGTAVQADVTDRAQIERAFAAARAANGPIEMLVVNAGIADSAPFAKTSAKAGTGSSPPT